MSPDSAAHDSALYDVIANSEDEYAIWPVSAPALPAWRRVGKVGTKEDCLAYVREIDMEKRPSELRKRLERGVSRC